MLVKFIGESIYSEWMFGLVVPVVGKIQIPVLVEFGLQELVVLGLGMLSVCCGCWRALTSFGPF